jgi:hypothetical protein
MEAEAQVLIFGEHCRTDLNCSLIALKNRVRRMP